MSARLCPDGRGLLAALGVVLVVFCGRAAAADWKTLHERADTVPLAELKADAAARPESTEALYALALRHLNLYEEQEAQGLFEQVLRLDPDHIGGRWGLAELMRREHRLDEAEKDLEKIMEAAPEFAAAPIALGYLLFDKDEYERSIRLAAGVLRLGEEKVDLTNRAHILSSAGPRG